MRLESHKQALYELRFSTMCKPATEVANLTQLESHTVRARTLMFWRIAMGYLDWGPREAELTYDVLAAQRHCKVAGIFVRLCVRDRKPAYLVHIPRVLRLLQAALARRSQLEPLAAWLDNHLPERDLSRPPVIRAEYSPARGG